MILTLILNFYTERFSNDSYSFIKKKKKNRFLLVRNRHIKPLLESYQLYILQTLIESYQLFVMHHIPKLRYPGFLIMHESTNVIIFE